MRGGLRASAVSGKFSATLELRGRGYWLTAKEGDTVVISRPAPTPTSDREALVLVRDAIDEAEKEAMRRSLM